MKLKNLLLLAGALALSGSALMAASGDTKTKSGDSNKATTKAAQADRAAMRAYHQKVLTIYDENGDGRLDEIEREALKADIEAGVIEPPPGPPPGQGHRGHRGPPPEIVQQYDANGDGVLDETEHAALRADIEAGKIAVPARPGGRGQGRGPREAQPETEGSTES